MAKKKAKRKVPVIEARGTKAKAKAKAKTKAKTKPRKSKGVFEPWEVWIVSCASFDSGYHRHADSFKTKKEAEAWIADNYGTEMCRCPVIVPIKILPMEY